MSLFLHWACQPVALRRCGIGLLLGASAAWGQAPSAVRLDPTPTLQASAASTVVPALAYRSVFADLPQGVESTALDWKAANAAVGQFRRGHRDILQWEKDQAPKGGAPVQGEKP